MKLRFFILSFLFISLKYANAQPKPPKFKYADFKYAIEIQDSIYGPTNVSYGYGAEKEFRVDPYVQEHNSAWFKLKIYKDTLLTFDIVPADSNDDYDFIIFKCPDVNCINDLKSKKIIPDRICYSYNTSKSGTTGLSEYATNKFVNVGVGPAYVAALPVKAGETYYLMIENCYDGKSPMCRVFPKNFTIYFYNYWPKKNPIVLSNVLFETNKTTLLKSSFVALDKLVNQLKTNKTMKIEIRGHTDNTGNESKNQQLSEERAKAVADYLVSKGIDKRRVFYKGFGSKKPIASNDTDEGRKKNRRVEFAIVLH